MKSYKEYEKAFIGASDIASLVFVGCDISGNLKSEIISFSEDGSYYAYLVDADAVIGDHYKKVAEFEHWLKIYDDDSLVCSSDNVKHFNIFRSGNFGIIIQAIDF